MCVSLGRTRRGLLWGGSLTEVAGPVMCAGLRWEALSSRTDFGGDCDCACGASSGKGGLHY